MNVFQVRYYMNLLESVQRRFIKRLSGLWDIPYITRLDMLKADTLELRRLKIHVTMYYKIINGYCDIPQSTFFNFRKSITRSNGQALYQAKLNHNAERYYFKNRAVTVWNDLPSNVVQAATVEQFKKLLNGINFSKFLFLNRCLLA